MAAGNFTGVPGIPNQDIMMWVSMGAGQSAIDHLGASDLAVVELPEIDVGGGEGFR